jgi:hypothetical protein
MNNIHYLCNKSKKDVELKGPNLMPYEELYKMPSISGILEEL